MNDKKIHEHITDLVAEEHELRTSVLVSGENHARLKDVEHQLDQAWDLLRQRRAKREFGNDPDAADLRDVKTVEGYVG